MLDMYTLCMVMPNNENSYPDVKQMGSFKFDEIFGTVMDVEWRDFSRFQLLINKLINSTWVKEFYDLIDKNRKYAAAYKTDLLNCLLAIQMDSIELCTEPAFVYIKAIHKDGKGTLESLERDGMDYSYEAIEKEMKSSIEKISEALST